MARREISDAERQRRREEDRRKAREAVEALRSSEGWQRWLSLRRHLRKYSLANQLLVALQKDDATHVAGFRAWLRLGYCVRRGERALRIWVPIPPSKAELERWERAGSAPAERPRTRFRLGPVFDRSQVEPLPPPAEPVPLDPPIVQVEGEQLGRLCEPLTALASAVGVTVQLETLAEGCGGYYHPARDRIGLSREAPVNQRVKTLVHELAHALLDREHPEEKTALSYAQEELVVESVAFTVCGSLGLDSSGYSIPYLASWCEAAELEVVERTARLIDAVAKRIEDAVPVEQSVGVGV